MFTQPLKTNDQISQDNATVEVKENAQIDGLTVRSSIRAGAMSWDDNLGNIGDKTQELLGNIGSWFSSLGQ